MSERITKCYVCFINVLHSIPNFLELGCSKGKKMKDSDFTRHPLPLLFEIIHGFVESAFEVFFLLGS